MAPHCNLLFSKRFAIHPKKRSDLGLSFVSKSDLSSLIYSKSLCDLIFFITHALYQKTTIQNYINLKNPTKKVSQDHTKQSSNWKEKEGKCAST